MSVQNEIENFLCKANFILFVSPEGDKLKDTALVHLLFTELDEIKNSEMFIKISNYFNQREIELLIIFKNNNPIKISLVDRRSGDAINIENLSFVGDSLGKFISLTKQDEKIFLLVAYIAKNEFLLNDEAVKKPPVILHGYSLMYM